MDMIAYRAIERHVDGYSRAYATFCGVGYLSPKHIGWYDRVCVCCRRNIPARVAKAVCASLFQAVYFHLRKKSDRYRLISRDRDRAR